MEKEEWRDSTRGRHPEVEEASESWPWPELQGWISSTCNRDSPAWSPDLRTLGVLRTPGGGAQPSRAEAPGEGL